MLDVSNEVKTQFLTDSTNKNLKFTTNPNWLYPEDVEYQKDMDTLNLFFGNAYGQTGIWTWPWSPMTENDWFHFRVNRYADGDSYDATDFVKTFAFRYRKYVNVSAQIGIHNTGLTYPQQLDFWVVYYDVTGTEREKRVPFNLDDYMVNASQTVAGTVSMNLETSAISATGVSKIERIGIHSKTGNVNFTGDISVGKVMVNVSDDVSAMPIPYVYNDYSTIDLNEYIPFILFDNDNIVFEDFSLTESLCSKDNLKFGLCEAGNIEVNTCGIQTNNLLGETLYPYYEVDNDSVTIPYSELRRVNWYKQYPNNYSPTSMWSSWNTTTSNRMKATTPGKVYLSTYDEYFSDYSMWYVKYKTNCEYFITEDDVAYLKPAVWYVDETGHEWWLRYGSPIPIGDFLNTDYELLFRPNYVVNGNKIAYMEALGFELYDSNQNVITATYKAKVIWKDIQVGVLKNYNDVLPSFSLSTCYVYNGTIDEYLADRKKEHLPLGKMTVKNIVKKTSHGLVTKKLTLYDDMVLLEQNAANWYSYMYGIDTSTAGAYGLQYARQIYSSYFNYMQSIGIENIDDYDLTSVYSKTYDECVADYMTAITTNFIAFRTAPDATPYTYKKIHYSAHTITADPTQLYVVKKINDNYERDGQILSIVTSWTPSSDTFTYDPLGRGLISCNVLIKENLSNGSTNCFAVDYNDLFAISENCTSFEILIPTYTDINYGGQITQHTNIIKEFTVYKTPKTFKLANADSRLLYYNYLTKEIFECDSTITGRDVIHSILELTGCFFRMSRENGKPEFVYCTKSGLYPAENLYPADDLYPRIGMTETMPKNKYLSVEYADYEVTRFGKIQILKKQTSNNTESNVQWQYVGDRDAGLNTYIVDDNIFYCNKDMVYDAEHMTELDNTLAEMYINISNMNYTPNVTQALGIPWLECGDRMGLLTTDGGFETFIYRRKLKGIQALFDTFESKGDEYNEAIKNY